jgi:hypothetical protein
MGLADLRDDARRTLDKNFPNSTAKLHESKSWWKLW